MAEEASQGEEICDFNGSKVSLPIDLIESPEIFSKIISLDTWKNVLTAENRKHLEKFLPQLPTDYPHAQEENLRALFEGENFKFGNPIKDFHTQLKDGYFYPDVVEYKKLCQKAKKKEYKLQLQAYYRKLLQEVMVSRQEILDQVSRQGPNDPIRTRGKVVSETGSSLEPRVQSRFKKIIHECKQECEDQAISSDEEERFLPPGPFGSLGYPIPFPGHPAGMYSGHPGYHPMIPSIPGMPYGYPSFPFSSHVPRPPLTPSNVNVTEKDFQQMLQRHKKRRTCHEDHPELDTRFTSLSDIVFRTNPSKRPSKTFSSMTNDGPSTRVEMNKKKDKKAKLKKKLKQKLQQKQERSRSQAKKQDSKAGLSEATTANLPPPPTGKFSSFFNLLKEIFYSMPDYKASLHKIEEQIKAWQSSPSATLSTWSKDQLDWVKLVYSSLMYISGSSGVTPSTFVPLVDFKERPQQWKWIGAFRDSDEELAQLCQDWLKVKDQLSIKKVTAEGGSTVNAPEARVKTDYVVRPSTSTEQDIFREQELKRYMNPHKAYTYHMHGFESVVGPVKGVFSKETNLNKAREHSLLVSNRPPFVTILTLVRDAAARLPNGEGTRAEVCELLKDSQFLNKDATEAQIHTVVSGALDRLHYEKDPCVKYDSNRKVWIYLHRNRTKEEFEKIHQANAAAARAKKMQKPRVPRHSKAKEGSPSPSVSETVDPSAVQAVASPGTQAAPVSSKPFEMKKPGIKIKIAGNTITGHPKVSVITSLTGPVADEKTPSSSEGEKEHTATCQPGLPGQNTQHVIAGGKSKLNTVDLNSKSIASSQFSPPSPGHRQTSALNSQTSALNSASLLYAPTGDEPVDVVSELREESAGSEGSVSTSNSENESSSGNESSSDGEESVDEPTGGKTKHGGLKLHQDEREDVDSPQSIEHHYKPQSQKGKDAMSQSYEFPSLGDLSRKEDNESEDEQDESGTSEDGEGSESEESNDD